MTQLYWLPTIQDWRERLRRLGEADDTAWDEAVALAGSRLDAVQTNALDTMVRRAYAGTAGDPRIKHAYSFAPGDPRRRTAARNVGRHV